MILKQRGLWFAAKIDSDKKTSKRWIQLCSTKIQNSKFKFSETVNFQGTVVAFFRDETGQIYYDVLDIKGSESVDNESWTGFAPLNFAQPGEKEILRLLGSQLIQLDMEIIGTDDGGGAFA